MQIYVKPAGVTAMSVGPVTLGAFKLGAGTGYTGDDTYTDIVGAEVLAGVPTGPEVVAPNTYRYTIVLDATVNIQFGEVALFFPNGDLFAIGSYSALVSKTPDANDLDNIGGSIDVYVQSSGAAKVDVANGRSVLTVEEVSDIPATFDDNDANIVIVNNPSSPSGTTPMVAFRQNALWGYDAYSEVASGVVASAATNRILISGIHAFNLNDLVQFQSGDLIGVTRSVVNVDHSGGATYAYFDADLPSAPSTGDQFLHFAPHGKNPFVAGGADEETRFAEAVEDGIAKRPTTVEVDSLLGRSDKDPLVDLVSRTYSVIADGVGISATDVVKLNILVHADNSVGTFWYNDTTSTLLTTPPALSNLAEVENVQDVPVNLGVSEYVVMDTATATGEFSLGAVLTRTTIKTGSVTSHIWFNIDTGLVVTAPPAFTHLRHKVPVPTDVIPDLHAGGNPVANGNPLPTKEVGEETANNPGNVVFAAGTAAVVLIANVSRVRFTIFNQTEHLIYVRKGATDPTATPGTHDFIIGRDQGYIADKYEWSGEVRMVSAGSGILTVSESS